MRTASLVVVFACIAAIGVLAQDMTDESFADLLAEPSPADESVAAPAQSATPTKTATESDDFSWSNDKSEPPADPAPGRDNDFRWSWESGKAPERKPNPDRGKMADEYERLLQENLQLRKKTDEMGRLNTDAQRANAELRMKIQALERSERLLSESVEQLRKSTVATEAVEDNAMAKLSAEVMRLRQENANEKEQVRLLREALKSATRPEPSMALPQSDLMKRLERENAELREKYQALRALEKKRVKAQKELAMRSKFRTAEIDGLNSEIEALKNENLLLKKVQKSLTEKALAAIELKEQADKLRATIAAKERDSHRKDEELEWQKKELVKKDEDVTRLRRELRDRRSQLVKAEQKAEAFLKEKANICFDMAALRIKAGLYEQAEAELLRLLKTDPDASDIHYNLGVLYDKYLNQPDKAASHYERYLELDGDSPDSDKVRLWLTEAKTGI